MFTGANDKEVKGARNLVYRHIERDFGMKNLLQNCEGKIMPKDMKNIIVYCGSFRKSYWNKSDLTSASANGSRFWRNDFVDSTISNATLQYCSFDNDVFLDCVVRDCNFSYSTFISSVFKNCNMSGASFAGAFFDKSIIDSTKISSSNFELCHFKNSVLKNSDLGNLTLGYSFFENLQIEDTRLPFLQTAYVFGGLETVSTQVEDVRIASKGLGPESMNAKEYLEMLPELAVFFDDRQEYFPLTNCLLTLEDDVTACEVNKAGILKSAAINDFRMLYFYCIQAAQFLKQSKSSLKDIYKLISSTVSHQTLSPIEYYQWGHYYPLIKSVLFDNPRGKSSATITLQTNIEPRDHQVLVAVLEELEEVAGLTRTRIENKHIEIRRNSPPWIDIDLAATLPHLLEYLSLMIESLMPIIASTADVITIIGVGKNLLGRKAKKKKVSGFSTPVSDSTTDQEHSLRNRTENDYHGQVNFCREDIAELSRIISKQELKAAHEYLLQPNQNSVERTSAIDALSDRKIKITKIDVHFYDVELDILEELYAQTPIASH